MLVYRAGELAAARDLLAALEFQQQSTRDPFPEDRPMRTTRFDASALILISIIAAITLLSACSLNVKKEKNGEDKQVDIKTPVGGIHVSKAANPQDVGIAVYPGARLK